MTNAGITTAYTYGPDSHRLDKVGSIARLYDAAGNATKIGGNARQFVYDNSGRMTQARSGGVITRQYAYNAKGEQTRAYLDAESAYFAYDEAGHLLGEYDNAGAPKQQILWFGDLPVGVLAGAGAGQQLHDIEPDHLGTPRAIIDGSRNVAIWEWKLTGEAFGATPPNQDPDNDGTAFVFDLRYPGQRYDSATGLNYNYYRDYEPGTGRYVQSDPIGLRAGVSTYSYVGSNPLRRVDQKGLIVFGSTCDAQMRASILQAIVELSNEITSKTNSAAKGCEKGNCDFALARDAMRNVATMTFSCNNTFPCAQTLVNGIGYFYPPLLKAPKASEILNQGQCGCLKGVIFHEATHQARTDMGENQIRRETLNCVSCAQNVNENGGPL